MGDFLIDFQLPECYYHPNVHLDVHICIFVAISFPHHD